MATGALPYGAMLEEPPPDLDWSPLVPGGAEFRTHRLIEVAATRLELRSSVSGLVFLGLSVLGTVICFGLMIGILVVSGELLSLAFGAIGLLLAVAALVVRRRVANRRFFDTKLGHYGDTRESVTIALPSIRGLQITPEQVWSGEGEFTSYELNLVLTDGRRVNVLDHRELANLHEDAMRIAAFLGVSLWIEEGLTDRVPRR
jgi:hypothetical protein